MAMGTHRKPETWEQLVNSHWNGEHPILSPEESVKAAKRIYQQAMGRPWTGKVQVTSGRRYTWIRNGVLSVNPDKRELHARGLRAIIHDISHYAHARLHPGDAPHSKRQAKLEGKLVRYALKSGFAEGRLASKAQPKPVVDLVQKRYAAILVREAKWAAKLKAAEKMLARARKDRREYERRHGERVVGTE